IALGILLAYFFQDGLPGLRLFTRALLGVGSLLTWLLVAGFTNLNAQSDVAPVVGTLIGRPLVALAAAGLLLAVIGTPAAGAGLLINPVLTYLGRISYGLYVYHAAGLLIALHLFHASSVRTYAFFAFSGFLITVGLSAASYRWLE